MAYQQNVIAQDNAATSSIARELQTQAAAKVPRQSRATAAKRDRPRAALDAADASERLAIKTRLSNLAMEPAARKQAESQLAAINERETAAVAAQRNADAATLRAYHAPAGRADLQPDSLASRRDPSSDAGKAGRTSQRGVGHSCAAWPRRRLRVTSRLRSPPKSHRSTSSSSDNFKPTRTRPSPTINATKTDLDRQFAALHGADVGATGAAAKELDALQKRRADLYRQIVDQVQRDAARIAKDSGFAVVFVNVRAAVGGYDMTNEVIKDVESQHE